MGWESKNEPESRCQGVRPQRVDQMGNLKKFFLCVGDLFSLGFFVFFFVFFSRYKNVVTFSFSSRGLGREISFLVPH